MGNIFPKIKEYHSEKTRTHHGVTHKQSIPTDWKVQQILLCCSDLKK